MDIMKEPTYHCVGNYNRKDFFKCLTYNTQAFSVSYFLKTKGFNLKYFSKDLNESAVLTKVVIIPAIFEFLLFEFLRKVRQLF